MAIKVLVIDDSALVRQVLTEIISQDQQITVVGTAADPLVAIKKIKELKPDVLTLDLEMPKMDGLTFLEKLMSSHPLPVVVISTLTQRGSAATLKALELGALDFVSKPVVGISGGLEEMAAEIIAKVKNAAAVNIQELKRQVKCSLLERLSSPDGPIRKEDFIRKASQVSSTDKVIVIGASTGGTVAVRKILTRLPANLPGILVVLHMPAGFTKAFAQALNKACRLKVKEAEDGEQVAGGCAYVAPGGKHLLLEKGGKGYYLKLDDGEPVNRHRPSVDMAFLSVAQKAGHHAVGVILTGMGDDGARGMLELHHQGAVTIAQDDQSCIVFGMPRQAIALGAAGKVLPLEDIAGSIINAVSSG